MHDVVAPVCGPATAARLTTLDETRPQVRRLKARTLEEAADAQAWGHVAEELVRLSPPITDDVRQCFEEALAVFPTAPLLWNRYAELELATNNLDNLRNIFARCLLACPFPDLWHTYIKFVKKSNEMKGVDGLPEIQQAYEFTLDKIGQDLNAGWCGPRCLPRGVAGSNAHQRLHSASATVHAEASAQLGRASGNEKICKTSFMCLR